MPVIPSRKKKAVKTAVKKPEPKKAKKLSSVAVTMVVDESGSMTMLFDATVAGFNEYVSTLKQDTKTPCYFSAITFDSAAIRKHQTGAALKDAMTLSRDNYKPGQWTPLLDAIGEAIKLTEKVMANKAAQKAIVVIQTDGQENSSKEFKLQQIKQMIEERQAKGWQFVFIGAGINAFADATSLGIEALNTVSYSPDAKGTRATFAATAMNTNSMRSGLTASMSYSRGQTMAAGESDVIWQQKVGSMAVAGDPKLKPIPRAKS